MTTTKTTTAYSPDDQVTIRQVLERLGIEYSDENRVRFNHAIANGELPTVDRPGRTFYMLWGDVLEYMEKGTHHQRRRASRVPAASEDEEVATLALSTATTEIRDHATCLDDQPEAAVDCEVVDYRPVLQRDDDQALLTEIAEAETLISSLATLTAEELIATANLYAVRTGEFAAAIMAKSRRYLVASWHCGKVLKAVKATHARGTFIPWLEAFALANDTSIRTLQRYMSVAKLTPDIRQILDHIEIQRQACSILGIARARADIAAKAKSEDLSTQSKDKSGSGNTGAKILTAATSLQTLIRKFRQDGLFMDPDQLRQLTLALLDVQEFARQQEAAQKSHDHAA
jgi:hypothetical protein